MSKLSKQLMILFLFLGIVFILVFTKTQDLEPYINMEMRTCVRMNPDQRAYAVQQCKMFDSNHANCEQTVDSIVCP